MNLVFFDDDIRGDFYPFSLMHPLADIRLGILTLRERWERLLQVKASTSLTARYLQGAFPYHLSTDNLFLNARVLPSEELIHQVSVLEMGEALLDDKGQLIAFRLEEIKASDPSQSLQLEDGVALVSDRLTYNGSVKWLGAVWEIFQLCGEWLEYDFDLLTHHRESEEIPDFVTAIKSENIFIEPGAKVAPSILNATEGPIYIARDAEVMEGCLIRGPFALGEHGVLKMGAKVYGATSIGYGCKVGGEVNNVVFFNHSNKGHDGFIGNAVIGNWCNLGADTNCSNLKNNYDTVKIWSEKEQSMVSTGLQFCGLLMGDHSKCGINTMFNTGTVVGASCNIFGGGFPDKHLASFTWGGHTESSLYRLDKALDTANRMMQRRGLSLTEEEKAIFEHIFKQTTKNT